ncbi:MAG: SIR2 family protein [Gammaproteobacteria bacterium]|nr:SIR2 family protein [Gammaproteobacteria bacterium]MBU2059026.1 SIR2 family protein [Gammaproteobacteria bacterium]MBU2174789.1 SIR2 family protein [Gammaproteobacteria bacterium]MBU2245764.1 SIR2 family protein [Gammaproteobacteria bacterium]MBU2343246.1 SIR2 family protein [Gammaproteobacteria bacterium]
MIQQIDNWCQHDNHNEFELFSDFNEWIDRGDTPTELELLKKLNEVGLSTPSKAFYAGDKAAYEQALRAYRIERRHEILSREYFIEKFGDEDGQHWFERNEQRFNQLIERLAEQLVVPFIGAGISVGGGFPTWANHLKQQGRTAGIPKTQIEQWLAQGEYELIIEHIEQAHGRDMFAQEIRDVFARTGSIQDITLRIAELFKDTLITTNYDRLLEQVFDTGNASAVQVINGVTAMAQPEPDKTTIIKIHGDIKHPAQCILGKAQYDQAYGAKHLDFNLPIPKALRYYFRNSSLLFIGCSLRNDRTIQVFKEVKSQAGDYSFPQHFAIEQAPEIPEEFIARNSELLRLGITAIWYPKGRYELVEAILRHAKNELNYRLANITSL